MTHHVARTLFGWALACSCIAPLACKSTPVVDVVVDAAPEQIAEAPLEDLVIARSSPGTAVLDAGPPRLVAVDTVRGVDGKATVTELRGLYYEVRRDNVSRRGYVRMADRRALGQLARSISLGESPDAASLRGELAFESFRGRGYEFEPAWSVVAYDPSHPPGALRAYRERLAIVTAPHPPEDDLDVLDCFRATTLRARGEIVSQDDTNAFRTLPDKPYFARISPTNTKWKQFWSRVDALGVWTWAPRYTTSHTYSDGCAFDAHLAHGGRTVDVGGYLATPPSWDAFVAELATLLAP